MQFSDDTVASVSAFVGGTAFATFSSLAADLGFTALHAIVGGAVGLGVKYAVPYLVEKVKSYRNRL